MRGLGSRSGVHMALRALPLVLGAVVLAGAAVGFDRTPQPGDGSALPVVQLVELPAQVAQTHRLVLSGGPFPYDKDGMVFANRERLLPSEPRGHYREYTVPTPGAADRGARRLVCGGAPRTPDACYYTGDHYASFRRIAP